MIKNNMLKKAGVAGIALIFIISVFIPIVSSQIFLLNTGNFLLSQGGEKNQINF